MGARVPGTARPHVFQGHASALDGSAYRCVGGVGLLGSLKKTFLESNVRSPSDLLLQWKVALRLLQDNDNDVRRRAELVVGELVNKKHVRGSALLRHVHKVLCETYCDSDLRELLIEHFSQVVESVASQLQEKCTYAQTSTRMITSMAVLETMILVP